MGNYPVTEICPYCRGDVILTTNDFIYGKIYGKHFWCYACIKCKASVGTHPDKSPLGRLANGVLKKLKVQCHDLFDPIFQNGYMPRGRAYEEMGRRMGIDELHFGWLDEEDLIKAKGILLEWRKELAQDMPQHCLNCKHHQKSRRKKSWFCRNTASKSRDKATNWDYCCDKWTTKEEFNL